MANQPFVQTNSVARSPDDPNAPIMPVNPAPLKQATVPSYGTNPNATPTPTGTQTSAPAWLSQDLSKNNPLPWQRYFDPSIVDTNDPNSLVSRQLGRNQDYYSGTTGQGVNQAGHSIDFKTTPLTGGSNGTSTMSDAIARKYQGDVNSKLQGLRTQREANAPMQYSKAIGQAGGELGTAQSLENKNFTDQYNFQMQRYQLYQQWQTAQNTAQANFLGNVLATVGTIAAIA